jgi:hypothetical protein
MDDDAYPLDFSEWDIEHEAETDDKQWTGDSDIDLPYWDEADHFGRDQFDEEYRYRMSLEQELRQIGNGDYDSEDFYSWTEWQLRDEIKARKLRGFSSRYDASDPLLYLKNSG